MSTPAALVVADWNLPLSQVEEIAEKVSGVVMVGRGVDHAILRDAEPLWVRRIGRKGSDHDALLLTFELRDGTRVRVLWWNVYVGQAPAEVLREVATMTDEHQPHIIALCEAYRCRRALRSLPGYRLFQGRHLPRRESENADVAVLVRRDLKIRHQSTSRMRVPWIGPKHKIRKGPRVYRRVWVQFPSGGTLRLLAAHLPTGGPDHDDNGPAVRESIARITRWAGR